MTSDQVSEDDYQAGKRLGLFALILFLVLCCEFYFAAWKRFWEVNPSRLDDIKIAVNRDDPRKISLLPGIGPVILNRITTLRESEPFQDEADFEARVRGIGPSFIANYKDNLDYTRAESAAVLQPAGARQP